MTVNLKINGLLSRIALVVAMSACGIVFGALMLSHFVVRTLADRRIVIGRETLLSAALRLTDSPRIQFRLAEEEMAEPSDLQLVMRSQAHARQAVNLSPWDYRYWRALAAADEFLGNSDAAEMSLRTASKLAPRYVDVNWALANLLLRQGQLQESLEPFRRAAKANSELLPSALDLLWQASGGDVEILRKLVNGKATLQLALAQFLVEQSQNDAAVGLYREIDAKAKIEFTGAAVFISSMLEVDPRMARELWLDAVRDVIPQDSDRLIWNGGFEAESLTQLNQFDWTISPSDYARIGFDRGFAHGGRRSLKVSFVGRDSTRLEGEIRQLVVLKTGMRYRLECYAKAQNLMTPEGPRLALLGRNGVIAVSEPVVADLNDWQNLAVEFTAKPETMTYVSIVRRPRYGYDEPTRGAIWFDDFKLTEQ